LWLSLALEQSISKAVGYPPRGGDAVSAYEVIIIIFVAMTFIVALVKLMICKIKMRSDEMKIKQNVVTVIVVLAALFLIACTSGNSDGSAEATPTPVPMVEPTVEPAIEPTPQPLPWQPVETTPAPVEPEDLTVTFESGLLGVKFTMERPESLNVLVGGRGSAEMLLVRFSNQRDWNDRLGFHIRQSRSNIANSEHFTTVEWDSPVEHWLSWQKVGEPEVFVSDYGLVIVRYDLLLQHDWLPYYYETNYEANSVYVFRADGRDYREIEGAQIFYYLMFDRHGRTDGDLYARAVLNSLQFHEPLPITWEPTAEAQTIGITQYNYPRIDGSTSTLPLVRNMIGAMYTAIQEDGWRYVPHIAVRTVPAYRLLIANELDLIIVPEPSEYVLALADEAGVALEFVPIAVEALAFITHIDNPVSNITLEQLLQIYTDRSITNWSELGGYDGRIIPLNRNPHSGSQTLMDNLVLKGENVHPDLDTWEYQIGGMSVMIEATAWRRSEENGFALGYTVYFFLRQIWDSEHWVDPIAQQLKVIAIDGVMPSHETILSGEYPFSTHYYAVFRADEPEDSPTRRLVEWLLTEAGQEAVSAAGLGRIILP